LANELAVSDPGYDDALNYSYLTAPIVVGLKRAAYGALNFRGRPRFGLTRRCRQSVGACRKTGQAVRVSENFLLYFSSRKARQWRAFLILERSPVTPFSNFFGENSRKSPAEFNKTPVFWRLALETLNAPHGRRGSALSSQCLNRCACKLLPPTTVNLADLDLESDGR
jgi:hypothetical protein